MTRHRGLLIAFEGIDGSGKSTQARMLAERLARGGVEVVPTREPTDGPFGRRIRETYRTGRLSAEDELSLFTEDRREHVSNVIEPALRAGKVVVVDRYYFSTMAYQGARGISVEKIREANEAFAPAPDLLFLFEIPMEVATSRIAERDGEPNLFEKEAYLRKCADVFDSLDDPYVVRMDGRLTVDELHEAIHRRVLEAISEAR